MGKDFNILLGFITVFEVVLGKFISLRVAEGRPKNSFPGNQELDPLCTHKECLIAVAPNCSLVSGPPLF